MGLPLEKREHMRKIRIAIKTAAASGKNGLNYGQLLAKTRRIMPEVSDNQFKRLVFAMSFSDLKMEREGNYHAVYFPVGPVDEPIEPDCLKYRPTKKGRKVRAEKEVMPVMQRTVPADAPGFRIPVFLHRTPMQWCVDVLAAT